MLSTERTNAMKVAALLPLALALGACAGAPAAESADPASASIAAVDEVQVADFVSFLRSSVSFDYDVHDSPAQLRDDSDLVVAGRFGDVRPGRSMEGIGHHVWVTVEVDQVLTSSDDGIQDRNITLELVVGAGAGMPNYQLALPSGRVVLFLDDRTFVDGEEPASEPVFALQSPIGMILEDAGRYVGGYEDLRDLPPAWTRSATFDEFVAALQP